MLPRLIIPDQVLGCGRVLIGLVGCIVMGKKLDDLLKKREQLNAQIHQERNKQSQQKRS